MRHTRGNVSETVYGRTTDQDAHTDMVTALDLVPTFVRSLLHDSSNLRRRRASETQQLGTGHANCSKTQSWMMVQERKHALNCGLLEQ
jgi:hypothetical protein